MNLTDRELTCSDCGKTFVFSADEQEFFRQKGFKNDPKRCKQCKALISGKQGRIETAVKCSEWGRDTTVPFKPTGKKPVLCNPCSQKARKAWLALWGDESPETRASS
jgi:CxxC-x17-CxxC domain-containing protein